MKRFLLLALIAAGCDGMLDETRADALANSQWRSTVIGHPCDMAFAFGESGDYTYALTCVLDGTRGEYLERGRYGLAGTTFNQVADESSCPGAGGSLSLGYSLTDTALTISSDRGATTFERVGLARPQSGELASGCFDGAFAVFTPHPIE
jgi:hypothetical protein